MPPGLKKKVGPLPVWGWALVAGGGLGVLFLIRKSRAKTAEGTEPIPSTLGANPPLGEVGGAGGGGNAAQPSEGKTPAPESPAPAPAPAPTSPVYERGGFAGEVNDVAEGAAALEALGLVVPAAHGAPSSPAGAPAAARHAATGGNPRAGVPFKPSTLHGHAAHEYPHAVPGGVGPGKRFVILPVGKKTHAAKPNHAPAHAKGHPSHHAPAPHAKPHNAPHKAAPKHTAKVKPRPRARPKARR